MTKRPLKCLHLPTNFRIVVPFLLKRYLFASLAVGLLINSSFGASIQFLATFSYPGNVDGTFPQGINDAGEIVGSVYKGGVWAGFVRYADGTFSPVLIEPNDTGQDTEANGVNNGRLLVGSYADAVGGAHGFLYQRGSFTEFDVPSALATLIYGVNNVGDFAGYFSADVGSHTQAFANIGGNVVTFGIPGNTDTQAYGINDAGEIAGSYFLDGRGPLGFFRDAAGNLTYPIHPPGSTSTFIFGINGHGGMVGEGSDGKSFFFKMPNTFVPIVYPSAESTTPTGINRYGTICGYYDDGSHIRRGFIAQISRDLAN